MRILLDEHPCSLDASTVGEAIDGVAGIVQDRGRMIVEVEVDGELWGRGRLERPEDRGSVADEIRLVSADRTTLIEQTLADADDALLAVDEAQREAALHIEAGEGVQAMARLSEAMETWQSIRQAAVLTSTSLGAGIDERVVQQLEEKLRSIADALREKDPIGLSDVLQYEMPTVVQQWREALDALRAPADEGGLDR